MTSPRTWSSSARGEQGAAQRRIPPAGAGRQLRGGEELRADVRRGVDQVPRATVGADRQAVLGAAAAGAGPAWRGTRRRRSSTVERRRRRRCRGSGSSPGHPTDPARHDLGAHCAGVGAGPVSAAARASSISCRFGDSPHTGSVAAASPVSWYAWHRQPPKSTSFCGQLRHGSGIHSVPRKRLNDGESYQISASGPALDVLRVQVRDLDRGRRARQPRRRWARR